MTTKSKITIIIVPITVAIISGPLRGHALRRKNPRRLWVFLYSLGGSCIGELNCLENSGPERVWGFESLILRKLMKGNYVSKFFEREVYENKQEYLHAIQIRKKEKIKMKDMWYKFLNWGLCGNYWGWFHALSGGVGYLLFNKAFGASPGIALLWVLLGAGFWEVYEYTKETYSGNNFLTNYGSGGKERFMYDAAGDIFLAMSVAFIASLG